MKRYPRFFNLLLICAIITLSIHACYAILQRNGKSQHKSAKAPLGSVFITASSPKTTYILASPKTINRSNSNTLIIVFRSARQLSFLTSAALRRHGWFAAGITSVTGSSSQRAKSVLADIEHRYNIKISWVICAGFSAGAQEAQDAALMLDRPIGLISITYPAFLFSVPRTDFPLVHLVGKSDFNYEKVMTARQNEDRRQRAVKLTIYPGGHSWWRQQDLDCIVDWLDSVPLPKKIPEEALQTEPIIP